MKILDFLELINDKKISYKLNFISPNGQSLRVDEVWGGEDGIVNIRLVTDSIQ